MARSADDPKEKEAHLRSSYALLRGLLDRFPDSSLTPKIQSNLDTVVEEMYRAGITPGAAHE